MRKVVVASVISLCFACGPGPNPGNEAQPPNEDEPSTSDNDRDGYSPADGDCNDFDPAIHPDAADDSCDGVDNDCSGVIDDPFNADGDPFSTCFGDCDDNDPARYPGAFEELDGVDNDCDGIADNNRDDYDDDGDGYTELDGDCLDSDPLVNPGAVEVNEKLDDQGNAIPEGVDNDCDGMIDEGVEPCDTGLNPGDLGHYPLAMELCNWVSNVDVTSTADARARNIVPNFGAGYTPHQGASMVVLSSGLAVDPSDPSWTSPVTGTSFTNTAPHPDPKPDPADGCGRADPASVNDYTELTYTIEVPSNANSLIYDFAFMSGEFPQWVCTEYDDTFLAILESNSFSGNISFDDAGRPVTINIGYFDVCSPTQGPDCTGNAELMGSGYDAYGGTGWLTTIAPVTPGETITLRFIIFDEGDRIWDSLVLIDNFRWDAEGTEGPVTIPRIESVAQWRASLR